jgi:hypothetical protein
MDSVDMEAWLSDTVGLKGKKLATCLKVFVEAMVEDLEDIRGIQLVCRWIETDITYGDSYEGCGGNISGDCKSVAF